MEHVLIAGTHTAAVSIAGLSNEERPELAFDLNSAPFVKFYSGPPSRNTPEGPHSAAQPGAGDGGTQAEVLGCKAAPLSLPNQVAEAARPRLFPVARTYGAYICGVTVGLGP